MYNIGIDIGGTSVKSGIVTENGEIISTNAIPTQVELGYEKTSDNIIKSVYDLLEKANLTINDIKNIGIGIPGIADDNGFVYFCNNLHWYRVSLGDKFRKEFPNQKIAISNDATVAAVAEYHFGAMQGCKSGILVTLGTGVGGGIILDGKVYSGFHNVGSEIGHMRVGYNQYFDCNCGNNGCLETFCSSTAMIHYATHLMKHGEKSILLDMIDHDFSKLNSKIIFDAYKKNDEVSIKTVNRFLEYLSKGIVTIINLFDPEILLIGGGISGAYDLYGDKLNKMVREQVLFKDLPSCKIMKSKLENDAGIVGASIL